VSGDLPREAYLPREVGPNDDATRLRIEWRDGAVSLFAPRALRLRCPCAGCVEEMTGERILVPEMVPEDVYPKAIDWVGRYALRFAWSDGHDTGIYPFDYLRRWADPSGGSLE